MLFEPQDIRGLITMAEAIEAVELGFREWSDNHELNQPRRRVHAPSGVRVSVHQGASPRSGTSGLVALGIRIRQTLDVQQAERHAEPVYTLFDATTAISPALLLATSRLRNCPTTTSWLASAPRQRARWGPARLRERTRRASG